MSRSGGVAVAPPEYRTLLVNSGLGAINLARIDAWLSGACHARTRVSHCAALQQSER
ncbi:hypothetical protein [Streptomyces sp. NBC_01013]|uniref:hypothetical protein n=1 Tax=Streptomyces sp. NBC_01013 TaxID=2903718 RepID=UPI00386D4114|nr:hypothetical protein OG538_08035 [Streptomyces sp. NBC_01013]